MNELNTQSKADNLFKGSNCMCLYEIDFRFKDTSRWKVKGQ